MASISWTSAVGSAHSSCSRCRQRACRGARAAASAAAEESTRASTCSAAAGGGSSGRLLRSAANRSGWTTRSHSSCSDRWSVQPGSASARTTGSFCGAPPLPPSDRGPLSDALARPGGSPEHHSRRRCGCARGIRASPCGRTHPLAGSRSRSQPSCCSAGARRAAAPAPTHCRSQSPLSRRPMAGPSNPARPGSPVGQRSTSGPPARLRLNI